MLSLADERPEILRPGLVTRKEIEAVIGPVALRTDALDTGILPSPGMMTQHYAPRAPLSVEPVPASAAEVLCRAGEHVGLLLRLLPAPANAGTRCEVMHLPADVGGYAAGLYAALHALDDAGVTRILVEALPASAEWLAVRDRLRRAAGA